MKVGEESPNICLLVYIYLASVFKKAYHEKHHLQLWVLDKILNELELPLATTLLVLKHADNTADRGN